METYLRDLMAAQSRQGLAPAALVHQSDITPTSHDEAYQTEGQPLHVTRAAVWARLIFTPISPTFPWLLNRMLKQLQPDVLHLHMPNVSAFWVLCLPRARRVPWVIHWHADVLASKYSPGLRLFYTLYRSFEHALLRRSTAIIATSPPYLDSSPPLQRFRQKCHVVPLGLDPANMLSPQPVTPTPDSGGPLRVLAIGRLTYYKGLEYLIRAAAEVVDVDVHIIGTGDQETKLKALAHNLGLECRITFHGYLPKKQLAQQFADCDCLCLPSIERTEAFGMVLLEAMYYDKATVISNVPGSGMGWVVDDGITGLHVPPENASGLAESLRNLQQDREKTRRLGKNGRQKFDRLFHIDRSATAVSKLYQFMRKDTPTSE